MLPLDSTCLRWELRAARSALISRYGIHERLVDDGVSPGGPMLRTASIGPSTAIRCVICGGSKINAGIALPETGAAAKVLTTRPRLIHFNDINAKKYLEAAEVGAGHAFGGTRLIGPPSCVAAPDENRSPPRAPPMFSPRLAESLSSPGAMMTEVRGVREFCSNRFTRRISRISPRSRFHAPEAVMVTGSFCFVGATADGAERCASRITKWRQRLSYFLWASMPWIAS